jgi:hypothetical protein
MDVVCSSKSDLKNSCDILFGLPDRKRKKTFDFMHIYEDNIKVNFKEPERENVGCIRLV